jgi:hypothetical protein
VLPERVQAQRVILYLDGWAGDIEALRRQLLDYPLSEFGLLEMFAIVNGQRVPFP